MLLSDVVGAAIHLSELAAREIMDVKLAGMRRRWCVSFTAACRPHGFLICPSVMLDTHHARC